MKRNLFTAALIIYLVVSGTLGLNIKINKARAQVPLNINVPTSTLVEADDFATFNFGDAWDMSEFTDISQYLNGAGRHPSLTNIQVENGVFSATSIGDYTNQLAYFYPLYSGYEGFIQIGGNLGTLHPIDSQKYQCLYIAMRVASPQFTPGGPQPDVFRVLWSDGYNQEINGGAFDRLYPETAEWPFDTPVIHNWRLYKIDLVHPPYPIPGGTEWLSSSSWSGLQINPTIYKDVNFAIDWIRLTTCEDLPEYQAEISWTPDASIDTIWARPVGTTHDIRLVTGIDGIAGFFMLDTKGLAPGAYNIGLGTQNEITQWSSAELKINQTPIIDFARPSPLLGQDYFTVSGNPWDSGPTDIVKIDCSEWFISDGLLELDTLFPAALPQRCKGPVLGEADSRMFLNMPAPLLDAGQYRYLSFSMSIDGDYSIPADGMIGRWMWRDTNDCTYVSADIPYDVGWHTYTIDLHDSFNGKPVSAVVGLNTPPEGCTKKPWKDAGQIEMLRFDPNENWTGNLVPEIIFHQEFEWIRLTKEDRIARGTPFPIEISLNKPVDEFESITYFYTTDLQNPTKNQVADYNPPRSQASSGHGQHTIYLPIITNYFPTFSIPSDVTHQWDTSNVNPGKYFICVEADDGISQATYCSDVPILVYER